MIEALKKSISQNFDGVSFNLENWGEVIDKSSDVSVFYLKSTVDYYSSYFEGVNLSFVLYENKMPIGICPLIIHKNENNWFISGDGNNLIRPLFVDNIAKKAKKRIEGQLVEVVRTIAKRLEIKKIKLIDSNIALSNWHILWLKKASKNFLTYQLAIDLQLSINDIRLGFRKSYKPLVNKALKEWDTKVCEYDIDDVFEEFRLLHLEVAGKETRNRKSWDIQKMQVKNKEALLVTVRDGDVLIGAGLFTYTKNTGSYSIGVYKRELFDKPIGHGVQMKAIEALKEKGCKTYHIGQKTTLLDDNIPTCKEMSISYFKEGFAGYVYAQPHLEVNLNE
jgi:FemAB family protein